MVLRRPPPANMAREIFDKPLSRIYTFWVIGIVVGAVGLHPSGLSVGGISFNLERPEIIQGTLFLGSLAFYVVLFAKIIMSAGVPKFSYAYQRELIYLQAKRFNKTPTLIKLDRSSRYIVMAGARIVAWMKTGFVLMYLLLPLFQILILETQPTWAALKAVLGRQ